MNESLLILVVGVLVVGVVFYLLRRDDQPKPGAKEGTQQTLDETGEAAQSANELSALREDAKASNVAKVSEIAERIVAKRAALDTVHQIAEHEASEAVRVAAEREAGQTARLAAEREAAAAARLAVVRKAAEAARQTAEREAAEAARLATERGAAVVARLAAARLAAEREAAQASKLAAERAANAARALAEREAVEAARLAADQDAASAITHPVPKLLKTPGQTVVMIADDSKVVRVKTSRLLVKHRYQVAAAEDGLDAAKQIAANMPDVLITDVEMPGMDGMELTRALRADPRTAKLPIIMITSHSAGLGEAAAEAGVDILLGKPYDEEQLIVHIKNFMA